MSTSPNQEAESLTDLDNARSFNPSLSIMRQLTDGEINRVLEHIGKLFNHRSAYRLNLTALLSELLSRHDEESDSWLYLAMSPNKYKKGSRYNAVGYSATTITVVKDLERNGLIEFVTGFLDRQSGKSRRTRIRATKQLIDLIGSDWSSTLSHIPYERSFEPIELRNDRLRIEYDEEPDWVADSRELLHEYNELLNRSLIDIPDLEEPKFHNLRKGKRVSHAITNRPANVHRVFARGSWDYGGRFYGGFWQTMPNRTKYDPDTDEPLTDLRRSRLFVNDKPCIERDYSALHLILLYAQRGIDYWTEYKEDPYEVPNPVYPDENRTLGKLMTLLAINAASRQSTFSAVNNELRDINLPPLKYDQFNAHFDQLMARHAPIADSFFADEGIKLQFMDSQIAEIVIREFTRQDKVVLSLHDGFVTQEENEQLLIEMMDNAFQQVTGLPNARHKSEWMGVNEKLTRATDLIRHDRYHGLQEIKSLEVRRSKRYLERRAEFMQRLRENS